MPAQDPDQKFITVTGSVGFGGAYPQEVLNQLEQDSTASSARTAVPVIKALSEYTLSVKAQTTGEESITGVFSTDYTSYSVAIPVSETEKEYKIVIEAKTAADGLTVLSGESKIKISEANPVATEDICLSAKSDSGAGIFSLEVGVDSDAGIKSAMVVYKPNETSVTTITAIKKSSTFSFEQGTIDGNTDNWLKCGSYPMTFEFYSGDKVDNKCTGELVYSFKQRVNIFDGFCTNTWVKNGDEPYFTTPDDKKITSSRITKALVESNKLKEFWVKDGGSEDNSGVFWEPLDSIATAVSRMNNPAVDYTIWVVGTLTGGQTIPASLTTAKARTVTICGYNGVGTLSALGAGRALYINTAVPVTIKNLKITGANSSLSGTGIYVAQGNLTISDDTLITGNHSQDNGGGIYIAGTSQVTMTGGTISGNTSDTNGGAVYVSSDASFNISGSAYIPYGDSDGNKGVGKNDVFLDVDRTITVTGELKATSPVLTVSLADDDFTEGRAILEGDTDQYEKIAINTTDAWVLNETSEGKLTYDLAAHISKLLSKQNDVTITVKSDTKLNVSASSPFANPVIDVPSGKTLRLTASAGTSPVLYPSDACGDFIKVKGILIIDGVSLYPCEPDKINTSENQRVRTRGIYIERGGKVEFISGTIKGFYCRSAIMGAICVNPLGTFNMSGGTICDTQESGAIYTSGTVVITGGEIKGNICYRDEHGAGITVCGGGTLTLKDGKIDGNKNYGGVYVKSEGTFNMEGGSIINNTSRDENNGAGVTVMAGGTYNKTGGTISDNTRTDGKATPEVYVL